MFFTEEKVDTICRLARIKLAKWCIDIIEESNYRGTSTKKDDLARFWNILSSIEVRKDYDNSIFKFQRLVLLLYNKLYLAKEEEMPNGNYIPTKGSVNPVLVINNNQTFIDLIDVLPVSYAGQEDKIVMISQDGSGVVFVDKSYLVTNDDVKNTYVSTLNQTAFTTTYPFEDGEVLVLINGNEITATQYLAPAGTVVTFKEGLRAGQLITIYTKKGIPLPTNLPADLPLTL